MHDISATISVSDDILHIFLLSVSARYGNFADIFKPINNTLFPSETLQMCAVCMMVLSCFKYDWNHFEKDNTLMCDMCRASLS